jgi:hypothetical protein
LVVTSTDEEANAKPSLFPKEYASIQTGDGMHVPSKGRRQAGVNSAKGRRRREQSGREASNGLDYFF